MLADVYYKNGSKESLAHVSVVEWLHGGNWQGIDYLHKVPLPCYKLKTFRVKENTNNHNSR